MLTTLLAAALMSRAQTAPVYFVVSEAGTPTHHDSYVLPLTSAADIRHARDLIRYGSSAGDPIAVCNIMMGGDGINRNVVATGEPLWDWRVTAFLGFAHSTAEYMDGWPSEIPGTFFPVEYDLDGNAYTSDTGTIGFWDYTVTRELGTGTTVTPPAAPATVSASSPGAGKAKVTWADKSSNEDGFEIDRFKLVGTSWAPDGARATLAANTTSATFTTGSGTFMFKVRAYNVGGSSSWASSSSVKVK